MQHHDRDLNRELFWIICIRVVAMMSIVIPVYLLAVSPEFDLPIEPVGLLQVLVSTVSIQTLLYLALLRWLPRHGVVQAYIQFTGDVLLITLVIYRLGSAGSSMLLLYLVVIIVAAALLGRSAALTVAVMAFVAWAFPLVSLALGWTTVVQFLERALTDIDALSPSALPLTYHLLLNLAGFSGVATLASRLSVRAKRTETELRRRQAFLESLYQDVIQSISSGVAITDLDGRLIDVNRAAYEILGVASGTLDGAPITDTLLFDDASWAGACRQLLEDNGVALRTRSELDLEREGRRLTIGFSLSPLRDADDEQNGYIVVFQDLTEHRRLEQRVRLQDRMAAVGEMAAGLAHEVGNPLAAISGSVQLLAQTADNDGAEAKLLDITLKESRRLDRTVKGFLDFARPRERNETRFDIARLLAEDTVLLENSEEVTSAHRIQTELDPSSFFVTADPDQVSQVFWNLARNAIQAMPEGGTLSIGGTAIDDRGIYRIHFRDDGAGMEEEERANLFHPFKSFFDGGMGIGMAIVYRIVEEHGGVIQVDSEPERGTSITIDLPTGMNERADALEEKV
ncbi:MAG: ATP-binding protein [Acidobacteriota bacterium]